MRRAGQGADARLVALLGAVPMPGLLLDGALAILAANGPAITLLGRDPRGERLLAFMRHPRLLAQIETARRHERVDPVDFRRPVPDGEQHLRSHVAALPGSEREEVLALMLEDLTAQESLASRQRDFVANVSHELRTPLTSLLGFIETLAGPAWDDPAARDQFLGVMKREAERMHRLVEDLMSLARVEEEERLRPQTPVDLAAIVRAALAALAPRIEEAGVKISLELAEDLPPVPGDPDQLEQLVLNLVENAVKYGGAGPVQIELSGGAHIPGQPGTAQRLVVSDHGPGIASEHLPRITERFYRVDTHRSRSSGGTGLGLAIVKHVVNRHRGRLRIHSRPGEGSRFEVLIPEAAPVSTG